MKSQTIGADTFDVEVVQIDAHGIWVFVLKREYFLPHRQFPWFKPATVEEVLDVRLLHGGHLHWPRLDVDLSLDSLSDPAGYPLIYH